MPKATGISSCRCYSVFRPPTGCESWFVAQAVYARWDCPARTETLAYPSVILNFVLFPLLLAKIFALNVGVLSSLKHTSAVYWLTNLLQYSFTPVQILHFKWWSQKQEQGRNSNYKSKLMCWRESILPLSLQDWRKKAVIKLKWTDTLHTWKDQGLNRKLHFFPETLSEIKLPSDIHPATKKSDEDIKLQVKANIAIYSQLWIHPSLSYTYKSVLMDFKSSSGENKKILQTPAEMLESVGGHNWTFKCALLVVVLFLRNNDWILYMVKSNHVTLTVNSMHGQPEKKHQAPLFFCNCSNFLLKRL